MVAKIFFSTKRFTSRLPLMPSFSESSFTVDAFGNGDLAIDGRRLEGFLPAHHRTDASLFILTAAIGAARSWLGSVAAARIGR